MLRAEARIIYNKPIKSRYLHCALLAPKIACAAQPGEFVNISLTGLGQPLLRRPFSIHRVEGPRIEILYEVLGPGTRILSERKKGEYLDIIGPLGNGFNHQLPITNYQSPILIAGGMGVAPLVFLAEKLREIKNPCLSGRQEKSKIKITVLIGTKTKKQILCEKEFKKLACQVSVATDDGSKGFKGKVTQLLQKTLSTIDYRLSTIYACGPRPMLQTIARISREYKIPAQVSLEEHMACGIGACLGCAVKTRSGYQRVCKEGPVFGAGEIVWE